MNLSQAEIDEAIRRLAAGETPASSSLRCPTCSDGTRRVRFHHTEDGTTIDLIHEDDRTQRLGKIAPGMTVVCLAPEHELGPPARYHMIDADPKSVDETDNM